MDASEPIPGERDLRDLSDKDLVRGYCADIERHKEFAHELWSRYDRVVRGTLANLICKGGLCPPEWQKSDFLEACHLQALTKFFSGICRWQIRESYRGLFGSLAQKTAIDRWRSIKRQRKSANKKSDEEKTANAPAFSERVTPESDDEMDRHLFRVANLPKHWYFRAGMPPETILLACEEARQRAKLGKIVDDLLIRHAAESEEAYQSAQSIRWCYWEGWTQTQIAAFRYGSPANDREKNTHLKRISAKMKEDYEDLRIMVEDLFGVTSFHELLKVI